MLIKSNIKFNFSCHFQFYLQQQQQQQNKTVFTTLLTSNFKYSLFFSALLSARVKGSRISEKHSTQKNQFHIIRPSRVWMLITSVTQSHCIHLDISHSNSAFSTQHLPKDVVGKCDPGRSFRIIHSRENALWKLSFQKSMPGQT